MKTTCRNNYALSFGLLSLHKILRYQRNATFTLKCICYEILFANYICKSYEKEDESINILLPENCFHGMNSNDFTFNFNIKFFKFNV